jgi:hypothetical protein
MAAGATLLALTARGAAAAMAQLYSIAASTAACGPIDEKFMVILS